MCLCVWVLQFHPMLCECAMAKTLGCSFPKPLVNSVTEIAVHVLLWIRSYLRRYAFIESLILYLLVSVVYKASRNWLASFENAGYGPFILLERVRGRNLRELHLRIYEAYTKTDKWLSLDRSIPPP